MLSFNEFCILNEGVLLTAQQLKTVNSFNNSSALKDDEQRMYYAAGENSESVLSFLNKLFPGVINKSSTPDAGGNHGVSGYFIFKIGNDFNEKLAIPDFSDVEQVVKLVNMFTSKYSSKIKELSHIGVSVEDVKKIFPNADVSSKLFDGNKSILIDFYDHYRKEHNIKQKYAMDWNKNDYDKFGVFIDKQVQRARDTIHSDSIKKIFKNSSGRIEIDVK